MLRVVTKGVGSSAKYDSFSCSTQQYFISNVEKIEILAASGNSIKDSGQCCNVVGTARWRNADGRIVVLVPEIQWRRSGATARDLGEEDLW